MELVILSDFMFFYLLVGVGIAAFIFYSKKHKPSRLRMRAGSSKVPEVYGKTQERYEDMKAGVKSLDCFFMFNGHEFNAYDVLEIPAGAPMPTVEQAYMAIMAKADPSQELFFKAAYDAIQRR